MTNRIKKVRDKMKKENIDNLLISKPENQFYLTGFISSNCKLIFTKDSNYLLTDFRYIEVARKLSHLYDIVMVDNDVTIFSFIKKLNLSELAVEEKVLTLEDSEKLKKKSGCPLIYARGLVESIRIIKEEAEIELISKAQEITDRGFSHMLNFLRPGITEKEAASELEIFLLKEGADGLSFDTIMVSGARTSLPHGTPSDKVLEKGDFITMDFGCKFDNYCSDMTRTVGLGKVSSRQKDIYNIVLDAQKAACENISSGVSAKEADKICRDIITDRGYGEYFGHGTGHGLGIEIHEAPRLNTRSEEILEKGMVVTIEPGIYLPEEFGVRIEDLAIITDSGIINLTKSEKELIII